MLSGYSRCSLLARASLRAARVSMAMNKSHAMLVGCGQVHRLQQHRRCFSSSSKLPEEGWFVTNVLHKMADHVALNRQNNMSQEFHRIQQLFPNQWTNVDDFLQGARAVVSAIIDITEKRDREAARNMMTTHMFNIWCESLDIADDLEFQVKVVDSEITRAYVLGTKYHENDEDEVSAVDVTVLVLTRQQREIDMPDGETVSETAYKTYKLVLTTGDGSDVWKVDALM